jgi:hypothetical protein
MHACFTSVQYCSNRAGTGATKYLQNTSCYNFSCKVANISSAKPGSVSVSACRNCGNKISQSNYPTFVLEMLKNIHITPKH